METTPFQRKVKAADLPLDRLLTNKSVSERDKLQAASRAFEAVLLRQILESAQKPVIPSGLTTDSSTSAIYRDLITTQLADSIAKSGQFGLARSFEQQWQRQEGKPAAPAAAPTAVATPVPAITTLKSGHLHPSPALSAPKTTPSLRQGPTLKPFLHEPELKAYRHE